MAMSRSVLLAGPSILLMLYLMTRDVRPPTLSVEVAPTHGTAQKRAPLSVLRKAAATYFPDMFAEAKYALPDQFEQTWANPCWAWEAGAGEGGTQGGTPGAAQEGVHCLPSFLILGVYQSGVRDLYSRLARHPGVAPRPATSPSFYSQVKPDWPGYVRELDGAVSAARSGKLLGEASAVTFHFVWVHQEKFNQPYVEAMGGYWRACIARSAAEKAARPHRECMAARMQDGRDADAAKAREAGMPMTHDFGVARERSFSVPQLMRAVYGDFAPALLVLLRRPWERMHAAFWNGGYPHYRSHYGADAAGQGRWAQESVVAFRRCTSNFSVASCALSFESLTRENEETFYHCDQLIKGMYSVFYRRWQAEHRRLLPLRAEEYYERPKAVLTRAMRFIGVAPPTGEAGWAPILSSMVQLAGSRPKGGVQPMAAATRELLHTFYTPGLRELIGLLRDEPDAAEWRAWSEV